ncbi:hypothetical protein N7523_003789 [Penicillium sp. IBT 18751x]|nr:hypothetical protein N7523_003789 [Penicillium sp. IBT 18751x]
MSSNGYLTKESILALGDKDPEYAEWQKANPDDDEMDWSEIKSARAAVDEWSREQCASLPDQGILMNISMRDGYQSSLRIFKPTSSEHSSISHPSSPVIVLIYGGAFCCGDNSNFAAQALALRALYGATVVLTSHRLVPEHPFPVGQQDIWDSLMWLAKNAESVLGADMNAGFIVGGVSSGGNTAATVGQMWVDEYANEYNGLQDSSRPKLTGMWLSVPFLFSSKDHVPKEYQDSFLSREQFKGDSTSGEIPAAVVKMQQWDTRSRWYSPINSPNPEPHKGLAKHGARVYFQAAGRCFARDDSLIYERILSQNGVETKLDIYPGVSLEHEPHIHYQTQAHTKAMPILILIRVK